MTYNEYKQEAMKTANYPNDLAGSYLSLGLRGESGEVCDKFKKLVRDKAWKPGEAISDQDRTDILLELGDVMWYVANLSVLYNINMNYEETDGILTRDDDQEIDYNENLSVDPFDVLVYCVTLFDSVSRRNFNGCIHEIARISKCLGSSLEEVCQLNITKLRDRQQRNALSGSGDHR